MPDPAEVKLAQPVVVALQREPTPLYKEPIITGFAGFAIGLLFAVFKDQLTKWLSRVKLRPDGPPSTVKAKIPDQHNRLCDSMYIRVGVQNHSDTVAKGCRAYLTVIARFQTGEFVSEPFYRDTLRLRWAYEDETPALHAGIDIPRGITVHFDLFSTKDERTSPGVGEQNRIVQVANRDVRYDRERLMNKVEMSGTYRFRVLVVAEATKPLTVDVNFRLGGLWSAIEILP